MIRNLGMALAAAGLAVLAGCGGPKTPPPTPEEQGAKTEYKRIAIVCAPAVGADAKYAATILEETKAAANLVLGAYLKTVDVLPGVAVDVKSTPPKVDLGAKAANYDGVCCCVYSYSGGKVTLDMCVINVKTGQSVWTHKLETADPNVQTRLARHGHYVPSTLKRHFYQFK